MFRHACFALIALFAISLPAHAQEYTATTAQDPKIEQKTLELQLKPLQLAEVEAEVKAWIALLAAKTDEISRLQIAGTTEDLATVVLEQSALVERANVALAAMTARGGDASTYEKYISASTGVSIDPTDAGGALKYVTDWLVSEEGGIKLGLNILKFLLVLFAFKILAGILGRIVAKAVGRMKSTSALLQDFFVNTVRKLTLLIGLVVALEMLGISAGPFLAAIGAAGFIIGFALQGTLSNFAAGIMILIYRPFDIGEVVNVAGKTGKVDAMSLVSTTLRLPDNQTVIVPNGSIWGDVITNVTSQETRRVDMVFGCGYGDDLQKAQKVLEGIISKHDKVLADPAPVIKVHELADSSVNFVVRPWAKTSDYWDVFWDVTRQVKERFDAEGLNIPFPQRDVHMHQVKD